MNSNLALSEETSISPSEVFLDGQSITEIDLESTCQAIVARLKETNNTEEIELAVTNLNGVEKFAARAKSKLIFEWSQWYKSSGNGDNFADWYVEKFGGEKLSVQKHQAIGELLLDAEVPDGVKQLSNKELVSVARAKQSGYDLEEYWDDIAKAGSEAEVNDIVRKVKKKEKRKGSLDIVIHPDGSIVAWEDGKMASIGWLNYADMNDPDTEEDKAKILKKAIARIENNTGMRKP